MGTRFASAPHGEKRISPPFTVKSTPVISRGGSGETGGLVSNAGVVILGPSPGQTVGLVPNDGGTVSPSAGGAVGGGANGSALNAGGRGNGARS